MAKRIKHSLANKQAEMKKRMEKLPLREHDFKSIDEIYLTLKEKRRRIRRDCLYPKARKKYYGYGKKMGMSAAKAISSARKKKKVAIIEIQTPYVFSGGQFESKRNKF